MIRNVHVLWTLCVDGLTTDLVTQVALLGTDPGHHVLDLFGQSVQEGVGHRQAALPHMEPLNHAQSKEDNMHNNMEESNKLDL